MRHRAPTIHEQLRKLLEPRALLTATRVATDLDQYVVLTLAPRAAVRFRDRSGSAIWESRVYLVQPPSFGIGTQPHYAALDTDRDAALFRHETLLRRLEGGSFAQETPREILRAIRPSVAHAAQLLRNGDPDAAVTVLEAALQAAGHLDFVRRFLHLYAEVFLMRALAIEMSDTVAATAAYREFLALHAEHPLHHSETLRAVAQAREAIERLTPTPAGTRSHAQGEGPSADSTTATGTQ